MKQVVKSLVVVGAMLAAGTAAADMDMDFRPFVGVDYLQAWMPGTKGTINGDTFNTQDQVPKSYPGATVYFGAKFMDYMGVEIGADWSGRKKRTSLDADGDSLTVQVKRKAFHADLLGFLPMNECFDLLGFLGIGWVKPTLTGTFTEAGTTVAQTATFGSTKSTAVVRLGVGASYMVTDMIGLRAKAGWENTKRLKISETINGVTSSFKPFKDTVSLSLGAFVRW
jgi:hypothetical protein